ncbi:RING finger domain-containing protein [Cryptosporidium ubiquitum]|uniref:RING finger domain-containing protein n=1 Tax=Cryptosporidium ubiquitum TaxID=857276 RepID=A0A1J4MER8_9CRYT|nr:RING finger domain-containing protein [Cryptosporidium ubiquitum]OII72728.1 RING finger domain-containing protein [Cryptosporidium ubiquitum]
MGPNIYPSRQRGDEANHILVREFQTCLSGYPDIRHYGSFENFSRPYTPLRDITGSIFGGLANESRVRMVNEPNHFNRDRNYVVERDHSSSVRNPQSRFFGVEVSNGNTVYNRRINDIRALNRSMSMSSPNIDIGITSGPRISSRETIENNSSFMNRSRSFADRIMEQFDLVEREHNRLTERIHRSQSIYEQIQRNGVEIEQLFDNLSHRIQRRHTTQRENSSGHNVQFRNTRSGGSTIECGRNINVNHRLSNRPRFLSMEDVHNHFHDHLIVNEEGEDNDEQERDNEDNDVIELIQVDDDEISDIMSRRNNDIRSRSLIIGQEQIIIEENDSDESGNSEDEETLYNENEHEHNQEYDDHEYEEVYGNGEAGNITIVLNRLRDRISQNQEDILGLPVDIQNALPVSKFNLSRSQNLDDDKKMCLICLDEFKDQQEILWLPCTHCFCRKCITSWFERGTVCPICKDDLLAHFKY